MTRQGYGLWAVSAKTVDGTDVESYFLNTLPDGIFEEHVHKPEGWTPATNAPQTAQPITVGITIG